MKEVLNPTTSIEEREAERRAARTPEEIADIKARAEARQKRQALIKKTAENVLKVSESYSELDSDVLILKNAIAENNLTLMQKQARAVAKAVSVVKKQESALSDLIPNVHEWHKQFSISELQTVHDAVKARLAKESTDLIPRKAFLEYEIKWVEKHKKYNTWKVAQAAYKKELALVQKKIDIKNILDSVSDALAFASTSQDQIVKDMASEMKKILSASDVDLNIAKKKAHEINKKYKEIKEAETKNRPSTPIKSETLKELKERLGTNTPKTIDYLEDAIANYEKTSKYGDKAKIHKDEVEKLMKQLLDEHDLGMNIDDSKLDLVLNSWFKNTFETGSSGGYKGSSKTTGKIETTHKRLKAAHELFGLGKDLVNDQLLRHEYEKYGNVLDHDIMSSMRHNTAKQYGNVEVRFKKDKVIATWTAGDSLSKDFQPSLVSDPKACSFDDLWNTPTSDTIQTHDLAKFKRNHISNYIELQYHGDLTIDCVESLTYPYNIKDPTYSDFLKVAKKWKEKGVKIYYIDGGHLNQL